MSTTTKNIKIPYPTEGMIRSAQLNDTIAPENSCQLSANMHFDRIGSVTTRNGVSTYATTLSGSVLSLGTLSIQGGVKRLLAQVGTDISSWDGASWTSVRTLTSATNKARYSQFLNLLYTVNGNNGDVVKTFDGTSYGTTNVGSLPKGDYVQAGFEGRIWVADRVLDRLYYTDIVQPSGGGYVITGGTAFVEKLSPQDGQSITGLFRVPRALLVFKQNSIFRVYGASSIDPYPAYNVGTYSQESIIQAKDGVYFHHPTGFFKFSYDNQPTEISKRVIDFVNNISRTNYDNIIGIYDNKDNVEWGVGSVTVEGVTFANCIMRYTISTQLWTVYDLASGVTPTAMVRYDDGTNIVPVLGVSSGKVGRLENGFDDFGAPIYYDYIDRWRSFTELYSHAKALSGMMVQTENAAGAIIEYQIDKDAPNKWRPIDKVDQNFASLFPNMSTDDFNRFRFRIQGTTNGVPMIFSGVEFMSLQDKGFNEN
ncbi:MAG: hypothetical protein V4509_00695 [Patescibacteria group bacterium]